MKNKDSRKLRNLMLLTSLCAILSCSSGGGINRKFYTGSNNTPSNPSNPPIVNPNPSNPGTPTVPPVNPEIPETPVIPQSRFTTTPDRTKLMEGIYDDNTEKYSQKGTDDTTIDAMKYGFKKLNLRSPMETDRVDISNPTEMTVEKNGVAFWIDSNNSPIGEYEIKNILFNDKITNANNLTLHMEEGSTLLMINKATEYLSNYNLDFSKILSEITASKKPNINGTGYNVVKFINSSLKINEDIDLDDENDNKGYIRFKTIRN